MKNGKEKEHQKKVGVLENTSFHFQLQKVRFRGSIQAKYVFEHLYWCCSNTCLNGSQRGVQTFERLLGSRSNTLFEHCLNVKTTPLTHNDRTHAAATAAHTSSGDLDLACACRPPHIAVECDCQKPKLTESTCGASQRRGRLAASMLVVGVRRASAERPRQPG